MNVETAPATWALAIASAERKFNEIAVADGNIVNYQREAMFAMQAVGASDYLQKCTGDSIRNAVINVASVGLSLSPALKLAYLVPRKGRACLDISYIGLVKIATDSGSVLAVKAELVRANDSFEYVDAFTMPRHHFDPFASVEDRGEVIGVYVVAKLANGMTQIETISRQEINKIRDVSKAKEGPWIEWFEEMAKKSGIKRASKLWPRTERLSKAVQLLDEHQGNETALRAATIDNETGVTVDEAREALEACETRRERLVLAAQSAQDKDALARVWKSGLEECRSTKDKAAYDALKAAVSARQAQFQEAA